ncbi:MAG: T9SS type A sorting domain-containing protein [bacterium]|nr:T9SS type A sorting domain-containing protein [bacterium]
MMRTRSARLWVWVLCLCSVASAYAGSETPVVHKTVVNASLMRTMLSVEFDQEQLASELSAAPAVAELTRGSSLLAIAGTGAPVARVLDVELGEPVSAALDLVDVPTTTNDLVLVGEPVIVHGVRLVGASVSPVIMTEQGLRAVRRVDYEVVTMGGLSVNEVTSPRPLHWAFEPILRQTVDNLDELNPQVALDAPARLLIMGPSALLQTDLPAWDIYLQWLDLKRRKGYELQIVTLQQIAQQYGDSTISQVRSFVHDTYFDPSQPPLVYAIIIGDNFGAVPGNGTFPTVLHCNPEHPDEIPNPPGDNDIFAVDGDDYIADVLHGRISAQSTPGYLGYFRKALNYELTPFLEDTNWLHSVTCTAGNFSDGSGLFPVTPVWNMNWAREYALSSGCVTDADTFYYHGWEEEAARDWTEEIIQDVNEGVCALWYRGWAGSQAWQYPVVDFDALANLNVGQKYPFVWGIVCGSGNFAFSSGPCLGEKFTTGLGTAGNPNGAIVFYGASDLHTNTKHNNAMLAAMLEGMQVNGIRSNGALALAGKLEVYRQYPLERSNTVGTCPSFVHFYGFHVFNVLGDPELPLMYCGVEDMNVNYPSTFDQGTSYVDVTVTDQGGQPVPNAIVGVRPTTVTMSSWTRLTDETGHVSVPVNFVGASEAELTVWKHGYVLFQSTLSVAQLPAGPWIGNAVWNAGADSQPNPGESVEVRFDVRNLGTQAATWTITATAMDEGCTIANGSATTPEIAPGSSALSSPISLTVSSNQWNGAQPLLNVQFVEGQNSVTRQFRFAVYAPDPQITELVVQDADGILSPGETASIAVRVRNTSTVNAAALTASVHSFDNAITFPDSELDFANVAFDQEVLSTTTFSASLPANVTQGRQIALRFVFSWNGVPFTWKQAFLTAGQITPNVPTGPDGYGYYAYENTDAGFAATPTYSWAELDPAHGGSGATAHIVADDSLQIVSLPQPFTYYGESYNLITVCSNGWLSFGAGTIPEFRNWEIPSPIGPPAMVSPMFDDLGSPLDTLEPNDNLQFPIYTRADANRFIVQWRVLNRGGRSESVPNDDFCTFQAVLEYPASGDGSILFLYNEFADTDVNGNYSTIGIQDELHERGLGLSFANTYLPSVSPVAAGRAIRFTTTPPDAYLGADDPMPSLPIAFALHAAYPNPFNPSTDLRFDLVSTGHTTLKVYDTLGREVATLVDANMAAGTHIAHFDAASVGSGVYFARLVSGSNSAVQKLVLMK